MKQVPPSQQLASNEFSWLFLDVVVNLYNKKLSLLLFFLTCVGIYFNISLCNDCIMKAFKPRERCNLEHERVF